MRRFALLALLVLAGCGSVFESFPRRACLYHSGDRRFDEGRVIAKRVDGCRYFEFKDSTKGDHGFRWVCDDDAVNIRPCPSGVGSLIDATSNNPLPPPQTP